DREHQRAGDFQAFLRFVRSYYRGWHVVLLLDEDPSHTAAGSVRLAAELGVRLVWLPKRCPELNPLDHLWGHAKEAMCGNRQDATIDLLVERFLEYLDGLSRWEALTKPGTLSKAFWLRVGCQKTFAERLRRFFPRRNRVERRGNPCQQPPCSSL